MECSILSFYLCKGMNILHCLLTVLTNSYLFSFCPSHFLSLTPMFPLALSLSKQFSIFSFGIILTRSHLSRGRLTRGGTNSQCILDFASCSARCVGEGFRNRLFIYSVLHPSVLTSLSTWSKLLILGESLPPPNELRSYDFNLCSWQQLHSSSVE